MAVRLDPARLGKALRGLSARQMPWLAVSTLNELGKMARGDLVDEAEEVFDAPRVFSTRQAFFQVFARKSDRQPSTLLGVKDIQAAYFKFQTRGGARQDGPGLTEAGAFVPVAARLNAYGNLPLGPRRWLARELDKPKVFAVTSKGRRMVVQRLASRLKVLGVFEAAPRYQAVFDFEGVVERRVVISAQDVFDARAAAMLARALG